MSAKTAKSEASGNPPARDPAGGGPDPSRGDVATGIVLVCLAGVGLCAAAPLRGVDGLSLGAGTMPRIYATLLGLAGLAMMARRKRRASGRFPRPAPRATCLFLAAVVGFALFVKGADVAVPGYVIHVPRLGLAGAVFTAFCLTASADRQSSWPGRILGGAAIAGACVFLFAWSLGVPLPPWPEVP